MTTGVVVMTYGTPSGPDDVERFYLDVRRGRPPTPEQLGDLKRRYDAIGGTSPLNARTAAQLAALQEELEVLEPGAYVVAYGAKHSAPTIEAAVAELAGRGVTDVVGIVLAPHYSRLSVGEYLERAAERCAELGLACGFVRHWHDEEALIAALAARVRSATASLPPTRGEIEYCFTAHSLPERILADGDPYPDELAETARLVAGRLELAHYRVGWQSAGRTPEPWIGPDILVMLRELAAQGFGGVVVCPAGFTADHLEVLYDLDIEAAQLAGELGLAFTRTASLNDDRAVFAALAQRVVAARPPSAR